MGHRSWVLSVAVGRLGDRDVIVSGGGDKTVRAWEWDGRRGRALGEPLLANLHRAARKRQSIDLVLSITSVAVGRFGDRDVIVSAGRGDSAVRVWEWDGAGARGRPLGEPLKGHSGHVNAVAPGRFGGRDVIVSAGEDRTVRVWEWAGGLGRPRGDPLTGHNDAVLAVAIAHVGDRDVIVSAGRDETVRLWDPAREQPVGAPLASHKGPARALAVDRLGDSDVILPAGDDETIATWDASTGLSRPPRTRWRRLRHLLAARGRGSGTTGGAPVDAAAPG